MRAHRAIYEHPDFSDSASESAPRLVAALSAIAAVIASAAMGVKYITP